MSSTAVLRCDGCDIRYWLTSDAARPLFVLTHGAGADHRMFDAQLPALAERYRVLTPLYRTPVPFLLVRGDHDNAGAIKKQAEPWSKREPNCAGYVVIPNAGHCANMDNPAHFNRVMLRFLDALPAQL